jgi:hypothetical protein
MLVAMSSETSSFPGGRKIRNESDESAAVVLESPVS